MENRNPPNNSITVCWNKVPLATTPVQLASNIIKNPNTYVVRKHFEQFDKKCKCIELPFTRSCHVGKIEDLIMAAK
jgi:hypothetical protein